MSSIEMGGTGILHRQEERCIEQANATLNLCHFMLESELCTDFSSKHSLQYYMLVFAAELRFNGTNKKVIGSSLRLKFMQDTLMHYLLFIHNEKQHSSYVLC